MACMVRVARFQHAMVELLQYLHQPVYNVSVRGLLDLVHVACHMQPNIHYTSDWHASAPDFGRFPHMLDHIQCEVLQLVLDVVDIVLGLQKFLPDQLTPSLLLGVCQSSVVQGLPQHLAEHIGCNPQAHDV